MMRSDAYKRVSESKVGKILLKMPGSERGNGVHKVKLAESNLYHI